MKPWMKMMIRTFLDENWEAFKQHCRSGGDEKMADVITRVSISTGRWLSC